MRPMLANRSFVALWCAGLVLQFAWWMLDASVPLIVFQKTGSAFGTGLIHVFAALPSIALGAIAGQLVDRLDRRRVMRWGAAILAGVMLLALPFAGDAPATLFYAFILIQAAIMTVMRPAENALLPSLVEAPQLRTANALNVLNDSAGRILGTAIGALLIVHVGITAMLAVCLVLFALGWCFLTAMHPPAAGTRQSATMNWQGMNVLASLHDQRALVARIIAERSVLAVMIGAFALYMVGDVPLTAVLPAFFLDSLHSGPEGFGLMLSLRGIAGLAGGMVIVVMSRHVPARTLLICGLVAYGGSIAAQGAINSFVPGLFFLILVGPAAAAIETGMNTLLQEASLEHERGRVFALVGTIGGIVTVVISLAAGSAGELTGTRPVVIVAGLLQILPALLIVRGLRGLSRRNARQPAGAR
ncbi:MAG TPA: MFS transporter [Thermomicrobiales bacterium]|nr:MFS transporter [Thermomicrobiales bacterium]